MNPSAVKYWLALLVLVGAMYGTSVAFRHDRSAPAAARSAEPAPDQPRRHELPRFTLTDQLGRSFDSDKLRGKVWVANFFFTNCKALCRTTNFHLARLKQMPEAAGVRFVSITCDPDSDTPQVLEDYARSFAADATEWVFLTGPFEKVRWLGQDFFQVPVERGGHSDRCFVVDRQGQVRGNFYITEPGQLDRMRTLLGQVAAEPAARSPRGRRS